MTSIWFPNNKYPPNTKNYLPCFVLGGGFSIRRKGLVIRRLPQAISQHKYLSRPGFPVVMDWRDIHDWFPNQRKPHMLVFRWVHFALNVWVVPDIYPFSPTFTQACAHTQPIYTYLDRTYLYVHIIGNWQRCCTNTRSTDPGWQPCRSVWPSSRSLHEGLNTTS